MTIRPVGDTMLLVEWAHAIDPVVNQKVIALAARLRARLEAAVRDIVPGYCSLGVHFDPLRTDLAGLERAIREEAAQVSGEETTVSGAMHEIPVRYGGPHGPDLPAVAEWARCSPAEVIERHVARVYRVYMLGFIPGFAYLGVVDPAIAAPRRQVPRERVPAGSVGIAGGQTGIYPIASPGGWQLIGRTDVTLFDPSRATPSLLAPGDLVRFVPV